MQQSCTDESDSYFIYVLIISGACYTDDTMCTAGTNVIHGGVQENGTAPNITRTIRMLMMEECCSSSNNGLSYRNAGNACGRCSSNYRTCCAY